MAATAPPTSPGVPSFQPGETAAGARVPTPGAGSHLTRACAYCATEHDVTALVRVVSLDGSGPDLWACASWTDCLATWADRAVRAARR